MRYFLLITLCLSLQAALAQKTEETAIRQAIQASADQWNRGSIKGFMSYYAESDSLLFLSKKGPTYGHAAVLARYLKRYPDTAAMGKLTFQVYQVKLLSPQSAYLAGHWQLNRHADTLGGVFLLAWQKQKGQWKIVADHTE